MTKIIYKTQQENNGKTKSVVNFNRFTKIVVDYLKCKKIKMKDK